MKTTVKKMIKAFIPFGLIAFYRYLEKRIRYWNSFEWLMTENEKNIFTQYIKNAKIYLEFGSGGSTIAALNNSNIKIYSVESSKDWIGSMKQKYKTIRQFEKSGRLSFLHADIGNTGTSGSPVISSNENDFDRFLNYTQRIFKEHSEIKEANVVLIDGRFRVACCLSVLLESINSPIIMFHDFWNRPQYHVIKRFVNIIDRVDSMMVCNKKDNISDDEILNVFDNFKYCYQ